ncbi:hypothetical protein G6M89_20695 [Natronolimnobius sp. AArcel1]|uniref:hypothetical protein n=1 Tax=Natronolimnobius sp. AArcel1 TaxID=1679093 RepID=UPI0013ED7E8B|nr:hypothetical protein [Natronolimnobius sp. AArcel1]NGM71381.1 hypothetical protein [Natronolimnobius sp. AArcel1]
MIVTGVIEEVTNHLRGRGWKTESKQYRDGIGGIGGVRETDCGVQTLVALVVTKPVEQVTVENVERLSELEGKNDADVVQLVTDVNVTPVADKALEEQEIERISLTEVAASSRDLTDGGTAESTGIKDERFTFAESEGMAEDETRESGDSKPELWFDPRESQVSIWYVTLLTSLVGMFALLLVFDPLQQLSPIGAWGIMFAVISLLIGSMYKDAERMYQAESWPRFRGAHYWILSVIPGLNLFFVTAYLVNRTEVSHYGRTLLRVDWVRGVLSDPVDFVKSVYVGLGVLVSTVFLTWLILFPVTGLFNEGNPVFGLIALLLFFLPMIVLYLRRYADSEVKGHIDIGLRDLSIRVLAAYGALITATVLLFVLLVPIAFFVTLILPADLANALGLGMLYSFFILPLAVVFVMPLRLLPWFKTFPYLLEQLTTQVELLGKESGLTPSREGSSGAKKRDYLPVSGHEHTSVELNSTADVNFGGTYLGYEPRSISEVRTHSLPSSRRLGAVLFVPGYLWASAVLAYHQLYPERATAYASMLPAEDVLLVGLSYLGIPQVVVTEVLIRIGLSPEVLSLGFIGAIVPAILMIPAAWHFALEYEALLYRSLQRIGGDNHLLLLWVIHIIPVVPLMIGYWWYKDRKEGDTIDIHP